MSPIVIDELDHVTVHNRSELRRVFRLAGHSHNFGRPAFEGVGILGIPDLDRSLATVRRRSTINPRARLEFIPVLVDKGNRVRTESRIPNHRVCSIPGSRNNCRVPLVVETVFILVRRILLEISTSNAFRHIAIGDLLHFYSILAIHKRNVVNRDIGAAHVVDFQSTIGGAGSHLPFNGSRLSQHVVNIRSKFSPARLIQIVCKNNCHRSPFVRRFNFFLVVLVTNIYTRLHPEIVRSALVIVPENLTCADIPRTTLCGNIHRKARILVRQRTVIEHKRQLEILGIVAINDIVRQVRTATTVLITFCRVGVVIEHATPSGSKFTRFKVGNQDRLTFGNLVND